MPNLDETVAAWDTAAAWPNARGAIHPAGHVSDDAYDASGITYAGGLNAIFARHGASNIADFGAGDGRIAIPLARLGYTVTAYDASPVMLEALGDRADAAGVGIGAHLADGTTRLPAGPHDAIFAAAILIHHRHDDARLIITNLAGALNPAGLLVLDLPLYDVAREPATWTDVAAWTPAELEDVAGDLNLTVVESAPAAGRYDPADPHRHGPYVILQAG